VFDVVFSIRDDQWKRSCKDRLTDNIAAKDVEVVGSVLSVGQYQIVHLRFFKLIRP